MIDRTILIAHVIAVCLMGCKLAYDTGKIDGRRSTLNKIYGSKNLTPTQKLICFSEMR